MKALPFVLNNKIYHPALEVKEKLLECPLNPPGQEYIKASSDPSYLACQEDQKYAKAFFEPINISYSETIIYDQKVKIAGNNVKVWEYQTPICRGRKKKKGKEEMEGRMENGGIPSEEQKRAQEVYGKMFPKWKEGCLHCFNYEGNFFERSTMNLRRTCRTGVESLAKWITEVKDESLKEDREEMPVKVEVVKKPEKTEEEVTAQRTKNGRRAKDRLIDKINSNWGLLPRGNRPGRKTVKFLTLTYAENMQELPRAYHDFKQFIRRLEYFLGEKVEYAAIHETQKRGAWHLHVLLHCSFVPSDWIKKNWCVDRGQGAHDIQAIGYVNDVGRYLAKYITKDMEEAQNLEGKHRYWCSEGLKDKSITIYVKRRKNWWTMQEVLNFFEGNIAIKKDKTPCIRQGFYQGEYTGEVSFLEVTVWVNPKTIFLLSCLAENIGRDQ